MKAFKQLNEVTLKSFQVFDKTSQQVFHHIFKTQIFKFHYNCTIYETYKALNNCNLKITQHNKQYFFTFNTVT